MRIGVLFFACLLFAAMPFFSRAATRPIQPRDVYRATEAFLIKNQNEDFLKRVMIPVFKASEAVMTRQLPGSKELAAEMIYALARLFENPNEDLPYIAAKAFLNRPDLFDPSIKALHERERPKAIAKLFKGWLKLKAEMRRNPKIPSSTKVRMEGFNNIITAWRRKYPQALSKSWREDY